MKMSSLYSQEVDHLSRELARMLYLRQEMSGYTTQQQAKMFHILVYSDEAMQIAVQSFKEEMECASRSYGSKQSNCKSILDDAKQMQQDMEGYLKSMKKAYQEVEKHYNQVQMLNKMIGSDKDQN